LHYPGRKSIGYFEVVRLRDGSGLFQQEPEGFDGMTLRQLLQRFRLSSAQSGRRVIVITGNAKRHHALLHEA
jgi:hypothetical protein